MITLKTKLTPPCLDETILRPRLNHFFKVFKTSKLITITAGAGYGKSIAAAQACRTFACNTVWYRLDESDRDVITLIHYLIEGIRQHYPSFGIATRQRISATEQLTSELRAILTVLLNELEQTVNRPMVIVLDDLHLIQGDLDIRSALEFLLEYLPAGVCFLLTSRTAIALGMSNRIASRELFSVTEKELAFTNEEITDLYRHIFHMPIEDHDLHVLARKSGGWAAGLVLFHYHLRQQTTADLKRTFGLVLSANQLVNDYLKENIFKKLPIEISRFLIKTSILPCLEVDFCNQLLKIDNAAEILSHLEKLHLFTFAFDQNRLTYCYHHLFRDFLLTELQLELDETALKQLYSRAALLNENNDNIDEAIEYYIKAKAYEAACTLIVQHGRRMIQNGRLNRLDSFLEKLPKPLYDQRPNLQFLKGSVSFYQGRTQESLEYFESARRAFERRGQAEDAERCLISLATGHGLRRDFIKAEELFKQILTRSPKGSENHFISLHSLVYIAARMCNILQADNYFKSAEAIVDNLQNPLWRAKLYNVYAFRFLQTDDFHQTIYYAEKAERIAVRLESHSEVVLSCHLISIVHMHSGEYRKCIKKALQGIRLAEKYGFLDTAYAWCLANCGMALAQLGNLSKGLEFSRRSLLICRSTESDWTEAWVHICICRILIKAGDAEKAESAGRQALDAIERTPLDFDKKMIKIIFAWVLLGKEKLDEAKALIESAGSLPSFSKNLNFWAALFHVAWNWKSGRRKIAIGDFFKIMADLHPAADHRQLMDHQNWMLPLLAEAYTDKAYRADVLRLISSWPQDGMDYDKILTQADKTHLHKAVKMLLNAGRQNPPEDLRIYCFGNFKLIKGETEIDSKKWVSAKARMLFKYLAFCSPQGYVPKERLLELIWPEQDPAVTGKRLHVALSAIRKILEPHLVRGQASSYILRQGETYKLTLGPNGFLDVAAFDQTLAQAAKPENAQQALELYLQAESLYNGHLLEDEPYIQWCINAREAYKEKYATLLKEIAGQYHDRDQLDQSIAYLRRVLEVDAYAEDVYCTLMKAYFQSGNRFMAIKTFEACKRNLEDDLQCPLGDEIESLYRSIMTA